MVNFPKKLLFIFTALALLLTPLYAETIHHAIHSDSNQADHRDNDPNCAVCHYAGSSIASLTTTTIITSPLGTDETFVTIPLSQPIFAEIYPSAQPRSPPTNS